MKLTPIKPSIFNETPESLRAKLTNWGEKAFRAQQILNWVYQKQSSDWAQMKNLPRGLREKLSENLSISPLKRILVKEAGDITEKLLFQLEDGQLVETVLIRYPQKGIGSEDSRKTVCVSSQVGCAYGCKFCASGLNGFKRNLVSSEILGQFAEIAGLESERDGQRQNDHLPFDNIVFMGMGEPLANYDAVMESIRCLNADWGYHFGARRITISTCGLVPQIRKLAEEPIQFRLAISLHGASNESRSKIMPVNRKYPLEELIPAAEYFSQTHGRMLTLEFILIDKVNDSLEEAEKLVSIAQRLHAHVNLIPYNPVEGLLWKRPSIDRQLTFASVLKEAKVSHTIRKEKGQDVDAACGQLRLRHQSDL